MKMKKILKWLFVIIVAIVLFDMAMGPRPKVATKVGEVSPTATTAVESTVAPKAVEYKTGDVVTIEDFKIAVNTASRKNSCSYSTLNAGKEFIYVNITLVNVGEKAESYNPLDFKVEDLNGNRKERDCLSIDDYLEYGELAPGGKVTGTLVFQIPKGSSAKLIYEPNVFTEHEAIFNL